MILHPWHEISPGSDIPKKVNGIIEIIQGTKSKYELDKEAGLLRLDRILLTDLVYPGNYGFIPQTYCQDEDPLDIIIMCSQPLLPLSIVPSTVVGALRMLDGGQQDDKILAVVSSDPLLGHVTSLSTFPKPMLETIVYFFENYKKPEKKQVVIQDTLGHQEAYAMIEQALRLYKNVFKK